MGTLRPRRLRMLAVSVLRAGRTETGRWGRGSETCERTRGKGTGEWTIRPSSSLPLPAALQEAWAHGLMGSAFTHPKRGCGLMQASGT